MSERGEWRGIYTVLTDTPEFQDLGPEAQLLWFHLKLRLGAAGIDTIPAAEYVLADATGIPSEGVRDGIEILSARGWLKRERNVFWLRNALKFEPSRNLGNENHLKSIRNHLLGLPKLAIVNDFAETYELDPPFPELIPSEGYRDGTPDNGRRKTEDGRRSNSLSTREADETFGNLDDVAIASIKGLYGWPPEEREGTDERIWGDTPTDTRPHCIRIAVQRLEGEDNSYQGKLFRRILADVIAEQGQAPNAPEGEVGFIAHDADYEPGGLYYTGSDG